MADAAAGAGGGDAPAAEPSTPRRRLADAIALDASMTPEAVAAQEAAITAAETALKSAEVVHRMGKKLDGKYALVTAFLRDDKVRVVAYLQETSTKMEILVTYGASLSAGTDADKVDAIKNLVGALSIDGSGKLTLAGDFPATWVAL